MNTEFTYKACDAKYAAKKALKVLKSNDYESPRLPEHFAKIMTFAMENHLPKLEKKTQRVLNYLYGSNDATEIILSVMTRIRDEICDINEKRTVMSIRGKRARLQMSMELAGDGSAHPAVLNRYDVIKVPTNGGWHYSIVTDVNESYVTCFPTTTATRNRLKKLGLRSVSLADSGDEQFCCARISEEASRIPLSDAFHCYKRSVADNPTICSAVDKVEFFAKTGATA